jgi:hypothetical protein
MDKKGTEKKGNPVMSRLTSNPEYRIERGIPVAPGSRPAGKYKPMGNFYDIIRKRQKNRGNTES